MSDRYDFCRALARDAGKLAHRGFGVSDAKLKGRHDVVTAMDREVERYIRAAIAARYPQDAVIGEEEGGGSGERLWIIDPIDGTANYARGVPRYCVSIGYMERARPVLGAIYDPSHDLLYAGARGEGAWRDAERLTVSAVDDIHAATVECGWSTRRSASAYVEMIGRVLEAGGAIVRAGSGALGLADVAAGRVEAYAELHINAWDCAAGIVLVKEAGGLTNDFFAGDGLRAGNPLLASNAPLCGKLAGVIGIPITN
ncbi:MAG TPA: inositol monophosphatase family protein [Casimicrobiaceae bacterium]|nr:inositol monophosphatase family protein [Casimicrobiaceae bacterium]